MHLRKKGPKTKRRRPLLPRPITHLDPLEPRQLFSTTLYVDPTAPGPTHDGSAWTTAYTDLQSALTAANSGDTVKVAQGTYKPTTTTDRTISFVLTSDINLIGGFAGSASPTPDLRDVANTPTILSGDIGAQGVNTDNSYHVLQAGGTSALDGLTITAGNASVIGSSDNYGGGLYLTVGAPQIRDCIFLANRALNFGGAVYDGGTNASFTNCAFLENAVYSTTNGADGGAVYNNGQNASFTNCLFQLNSACTIGGAVFNDRGSAAFTNCTFDANLINGQVGQYGAAIAAGDTVTTLVNSVVWNHGPNAITTGTFGTFTAITSDIQPGTIYGPYVSSGVLNIDPQFVRSPWTGGDGMWGTPDDDLGDLRLRPTSPALDAGSNQQLLPGDITDLLGHARVQSAAVDLGAYEGPASDAPAPRTLYVSASASNPTPTGTSWSDPFRSLNAALAAAADGDTVRVAAGIYTPTSATDRSATFNLRTGVTILGGYAGPGSSDPNARDTTAHPSILSGEIGSPSLTADNSLHVLSASLVNTTATFDGFTITDGTGSDGAGLYAYVSNPTVSNCTFSNNAASRGGAAFLSPGTTDLRFLNTTFANNSASSGGGAVYADNASNVNLSGCTLSNNSAPYGGALYVNNTTAPITAAAVVLNCTLTGNTAAWEGGAIYTLGSLSATATTFADNSCGSDTISGGAGGAVALTAVPASFTDCTFTGNSAAGAYGGAVSGIANFTRCSFAANTALEGGAVAATNFDIVPAASCSFTDCTFTRNSAIAAATASFAGGGALYFSPNNATPTSLTLTRCAFFGNTAAAAGARASAAAAGLYSSAPTTLLDCLFVGNSVTAYSADGGGGTIAAPLTVVGCTFAYNHVDGTFSSSTGGLFAGNSAAAVTNCISWGNFANNSPQLRLSNLAPQPTFCDIQGGGFFGTADNNADPLFVRTPSPGHDGVWGTPDDDYGDLRLRSASSPAIDAGSNAALPPGDTTDLLNRSRIIGNAVDLGAYEGVADTTAPTASLSSSLTAPAAGAATISVTVRFSDNVAVDPASLATSNLLLTGPSGPISPTSVSGTPAAATYTFLAPGGSWDYIDNGNYTLTLLAGQVHDTSNNPAPATTLGSFSLNLATPPSATLTAPATAPEGSATTTLSLTTPTGTAPFTYSFDFNNDNTFEISNSPTPSATIPAQYLPDGPNTLTLHARITGPAGSTDYTAPLTITNAPPTAKIAPPSPTASYTAGQSYTFTASAADPSPTDTAAGFTYAWSISSGTGAAATLLASGAGATIPFAPAAAGPYTLTLTATDKDGATSAPATTVINVADFGAPTALIIDPPTSIQANTPLTLRSPVIDPAPGNPAPFTCHWTATLNGQTIASLTGGYQFTFTPTAPGQLTVTLTLTNGAAKTSAPATADITVTAAPPPPDTTPPAAQPLASLPAPAPGSSSYTFSVTYTDNSAINPASLANTNLLITGPSGFSTPATLLSITGSGPAVTATYAFPPPDFAWDSADNGIYTIALAPNQVTDTANNPAPAATLGSLTVNLPNQRPTDTTPPTAALARPLSPPAAGAADYTVTVTYTDDIAIDPNTLDSADLLLTGPANYSAQATLLSITGSGATLSATYSFPAPGGSWDFPDNGPYTLSLQPNQVTDTANNPALPTALGAFTANLPNPDAPILSAEQGTRNPASPNLVVSTFALKKPPFVNGALLSGSNLSGTIALRNTGHANLTGSATITLYLSSDATASTADTVLKSFTLPLKTLKPGKSTKSTSFTLTLPATLADGTQNLIAVITPLSTESTTLDNAKSLSFHTAPAETDLAATALKLKKGKHPAATLTVKNTGNQLFNHTVPIALTFTDNATGNTTSLPTLTALIKNLKPGQLKSLSLKSLPPDLATHHGTLTATLDPSDLLAQSSTTNDTATATL